MTKTGARIRFLRGTFGNDSGDVVKVVVDTDTEVCYYDCYRRWCSLPKTEAGTIFEYVAAGQRLPRRLVRASAKAL